MFEDLQGLGDAIEIKKHVDTIKDQVKYLKTAVEHAIELNKDKIPSNVNGNFFSLPYFPLIIDLIILQPLTKNLVKK
jgi:hypothetical protein